MGYASKAGRARTSSRNPQAHAICDKCGGRFNHVDLHWQYDWAGASLKNKNMLVCDRCLDLPQQQLRAIVLPTDPVPIYNPRPQLFFVEGQTMERATSGPGTTDPKTGIPVPGGGAVITTPSGDVRSTQQTGEPPGGINQTPGTDPNAPGSSQPDLPYQNVQVPKTGPLK